MAPRVATNQCATNMAHGSRCQECSNAPLLCQDVAHAAWAFYCFACMHAYEGTPCATVPPEWCGSHVMISPWICLVKLAT